jgi:acyl carrier protein
MGVLFSLPVRHLSQCGGAILTKDAFGDLVSQRTGVPREGLDSGSRLGADPGLDSFGLLELTTSLAELGVELDERAWLATETVRACWFSSWWSPSRRISRPAI